MKKLILLACVVACFTLEGCYTHKAIVGNGPQGNVQVTEKNHYLVYGLAPVKTSNPKDMAKGAEDYQVEHKHTFVDGLINFLTCGLYTPTTTVVTK